MTAIPKNFKDRKIFYIAGLILFSIIILCIRLYNHSYFLADSYEYLGASDELRHIWAGHVSTDGFLILKRVIIYPLFLMISSHIIFLIIIQIILVSAVMYGMIRHLISQNTPIDWKVFLIFICTPSIFLYSHMIMAEWVVFILITLLYFVTFHKGLLQGQFLIQSIIAMLAFTKPVFYPFVYLNLIFFITFSIYSKRILFWAVIPTLMVIGYKAYNYKKYGISQFSSIEQINIVRYNCQYFLSSMYSPDIADKWISSIEEKTKNLNYPSKVEMEKTAAYDVIRNHIVQYSFYHLKGSIRGMFDPGRFDVVSLFQVEDGNQGFLEILNGKKPLKNILNTTSWLLIIILIPIFLINLLKWIFATLYIFQSIWTPEKIYILLILLYLVLVTGPINASRFMMPLQGILIIWAMLGYKMYKNKYNHTAPK